MRTKREHPDVPEVKPGEAVNELGQEIQTATVSGHNVQVARPVVPAPRVPTLPIAPHGTGESGIRPEYQPETANVRSQVPVLEQADREARREVDLDPLDAEYLKEVEALTEKYRKKREEAFEKAEDERLKNEEKARKASEKAAGKRPDDSHAE